MKTPPNPLSSLQRPFRRIFVVSQVHVYTERKKMVDLTEIIELFFYYPDAKMVVATRTERKILENLYVGQKFIS